MGALRWLPTRALTRWRGRSVVRSIVATAMAMLLFIPAMLIVDIHGRYFENGAREAATITDYLPFNMPNLPTNRKVFAHYMPNFPISIDNSPADRDYYATQYLSPEGEGGIHADYGGLVRDRPLPRPPIDRPDWRDEDLRTEIRQAQSVAIDGFAVDVIVPRGKSLQSMAAMAMMSAADSVGEFSVFVTADMAGPLQFLKPADFADEFVSYLRAPAAFRLEDGRPVLGAFLAERMPVAWWTDVISRLKSDFGVDVAFVPTFLDAAKNIDSFAAISYGFSNWGGRSPTTVSTELRGPNYPVDLVQRTHALGKIWMQPVAYQDNRPREGNYQESGNGITSRLSWQVALSQGVDWVQLITWNDYAEMTAFAPSDKHGWALLDMNAFGIAYFKFGIPPTILRDAIYLSYRTQPVSARARYPERDPMELVPESAPARDAVEVVTFAVSASTVKAQVGSASYSCDVPKGIGVCTFSLQLGSIAARMYRDGDEVASAHASLPVTDSPYVQDFQYVLAGGLR